MNRLRQERGAALIIVLILTVVALVAAVGLLYMVGKGGYVLAQQNRFRTAVQAAKGGAEVTFKVIGERGVTNPGFLGAYLQNKLSTATTAWPAGADNAITINPDNTASFDISFTLGNYTVYSKIVDTIEGNSGAAAGLKNGGVVNTGSGEVVVVSMPYLYTIEELVQSTVNPSERVKFSILYQY